MGGAVSVSPNKDLLATESLQALHGLNLSIAQRSFPALQSLSSLSDDDIHRLVQALRRQDGPNQDSLIAELDSIQTYLNRLKKSLIESPPPIPTVSAEAEKKSDDLHILAHSAKQDDKNESKVVDTKPINLGTDGKMYPFAVSLEFFLHFLKEHPEAETMTTAEVVYKIIIPETKESKLTYVEAFLVGKHSKYFRVLKPGYSYDEQTSFLSHAWLMPFRTVIDIAISAMRPLFTNLGYIPPLEDYAHKSFFWMDVFCKNQHIPAPAMDEFETAMRLSNQVVLALYPVAQIKMQYGDISRTQQQHRQAREDAANGKLPQPIVLSRIWCLFEIMTCLNMKKSLVPAVTDDNLSEIRPELFIVDVCKAQATVPADVEMILGLVKASVGIDEMNHLVKKAVEDSILMQIATLDPSCFDGDGWVYTPSTNNANSVELNNVSKRLVKDVRKGDKVLTCLNPTASAATLQANPYAVVSAIKQYPSLFAWATVSLITKDDVSSFNQKQLPDNDSMSLWDVQGLTITAEHPVWDSHGGKWVKARECTGAMRSAKTLNYVYNIELELDCDRADITRNRHGNVLVNDMMVMTLGHGYDFDAETDKLYGYGWHDNPTRKQQMMLQDIREQE